MNLNQLTIQEYYSNKKAVEELKMPRKSIEHAIEEALEWFSETNKIN